MRVRQNKRFGTVFLAAWYLISGLASPGFTHPQLKPENQAQTHSPLDMGNTMGCDVSNCHGGSGHTYNAVLNDPSFTFSGISGTSYTPSQVYTLTVNIGKFVTYVNGNGFEITSENATAKKGTFVVTDPLSTLLVGGSPNWLGQNRNGRATPHSWTFQWRAPTAGAGTVCFYVVGMADPARITGTGYFNKYCYTETASAQPATIVTDPVNKTVSSGQTATFSVTASGTAPITYQWQKAPSGSLTFANIPGAASPSYTTPATTPSDDGNKYRCFVSNSAGNDTSSAATLTVTVTATPPSIVTQPANQTVTVGQTAGFSVTASGSLPLTYQWQKAPSGSSTYSNIPSATSANYTTPATSLTDDGNKYRCVVTNSVGNVTSAAATLTVNAIPPSITTQPVNKTVTAGQTATFSVTASGTAPLTYKWQKAPSGNPTFADIPGATAASYITPATTLANDGDKFRCVVTNSGGTATSNAATLSVNAAPPTITIPPQDQNVLPGQTATFSVTAAGTLPLTYQWQKAPSGNPTYSNIPGATSASYMTSPVTMADDGNKYRCVVTNSAGNVTSSAATLTVTAVSSPPSIVTQPSDQTVTVGQTATFTVSASGTAPLSYQWQSKAPGGSGFTDIPGATAVSYTTPSVALSDDGTQFRCVVRNGVGNVTSNTATLNVNASGPVITTDPIDQTVAVGQTAVFDVTATGTPPLTYRWQSAPSGNPSFTDIPGATGSTYTTPAALLTDDGKKFHCIVTNGGGTATSASAVLHVNSTPPSITTQPANQPVLVGQTATFDVTATGTLPLSYRWQKAPSGGSSFTNIPGATSQSYTTPPATLADDGSQFRCVVTNGGGSVTSSIAILSVTVTAVPPTVTTQPASITVPDGGTATFNITASGSTPLSYQWQSSPAGGSGFTNIPGATAASYTTPPVDFSSDNGTRFRCFVINAAGNDTSQAATLTITQGVPVITQQPQDARVPDGQSATFLITAVGGTLSYQWYRDGRAISGQTGAAYMIPVVTLGDNGARFACLVTNGFGSITSNEARLIIAQPLVAPQFSNFQPVMRLNDTLQISTQYTLPVTYTWSFTQLGPPPGVSGAKPAAGSGTSAKTTTPSGALTLSALNLTQGEYQVSVFATTSFGDVSPTTSASVTFLSGDFSGARVYPNPWRSDRHSSNALIFDNMPPATTVKVFTIAGHLITSLDAPAGFVQWDLKNKSGSEVASGIYLYLLSDGSGNQKRGKLAVIR